MDDDKTSYYLKMDNDKISCYLKMDNDKISTQANQSIDKSFTIFLLYKERLFTNSSSMTLGNLFPTTLIN